MPNLVLDLEVNRVDLVDEGANSAAFIKLYKRKERDTTMEFEEILKAMKPEHAEAIRAEIAKAKGEVPETVSIELTKAKEDIAKAAEDLKLANDAKKIAELKAENLEKEKKSAGTCTDEEEIMKSLDPAVQNIFKSIKLQKEAAEIVVKQMNEQKLTDEAIAKAKELKSLPVDEAKLVEIVKGASTEVYEVLKAANAAIETGATFDEVGKSRGNNDAADAWSRIEKKAEEFITVDDKLTKQQAITKTIKANPDLYREYLKGGAN